ncbi:MAG: NAD(P)/FAD-dependent oxidoreductase [Candidatus Ventricola sp.]
MRYVIIGGSAAAVGCIEGIRAVDKAGEITLVSREPYPFYGRPLISYLLEGKTTQDKLLAYRPADYEERMGVHALRGVSAVAVDSKKKTVLLEDGRTLPYDRLLLATGSNPFVPKMDGLDAVANKTSFMTLDDALSLRAMLGEGRDKRVLIVGAGLVGLKCAEGILSLAASIDVVDLAPRILPTTLPEEPAAIVQRQIERAGVRFHLNDSVARFEPGLAHLQSGGEVPFDVLVLCVGVRANTALAQSAGCAVERGIVVDSRMQTTMPDIYAAGDCTVQADPDTGRLRALAIWPNASMQGETAGRNMAGACEAFDKGIPMNATGFMGLHSISAGVYEGEQLLTHTADTYKLLCVKGDRLVGFILLGNIDRAGIYTALVRERTPLSSIDFDLIRDTPQLMAFSATERAKKLGGGSL